MRDWISHRVGVGSAQATILRNLRLIWPDTYITKSERILITELPTCWDKITSKRSRRGD